MRKVLMAFLVLVMCVGLASADTIKGKVTPSKDLEFKFTTQTSGVVHTGLFWTKKAVDLDGFFYVIFEGDVLVTGMFFTYEEMYEACSFGMIEGVTVYAYIWTLDGSCSAWLNVQQTGPDIVIKKAGELEVSEYRTEPDSEIGLKVRNNMKEMRWRKAFY